MKDATEESLTIHLNAISKVVNAFKELQPLRLTNEVQLKVCSVCYVSPVGNNILCS